MGAGHGEIHPSGKVKVFALLSNSSHSLSVYRVVEENLPRESLYIADELFFTGSAAEVTPIRSVDRLAIGQGRGPITRQVQEEFFALMPGAAAILAPRPNARNQSLPACNHCTPYHRPSRRTPIGLKTARSPIFNCGGYPPTML